MATPMTLAQMESQLRKWGVPFSTNSDAGTWSRTAPGWPWGPVYGSMVHHTGDDLPDDTDERVIHDGRTGLSGPLAHFGGRDNGWFDIVSCGRANHAGGGDPAVLEAVIGETYGDYPPASRFHDGMAGQEDGNTRFYGTENYYSGSHTPANYHAMVRQQAAICDFHGWSAKSVIGHKEWSNWKPDPGQVDMKTFRADIQWCLDNGPAAAASRFPIAGAAAPAPTAGDDMAYTEDQLKQMFRDVLNEPTVGDRKWSAPHVWDKDLRDGEATGKAVSNVDADIQAFQALMQSLDAAERARDEAEAQRDAAMQAGLDAIAKAIAALPTATVPAAQPALGSGTYTLTFSPTQA